MTLTLKRGQSFADIFPAADWAKLFPASRSADKGKRLNARKYVGVLNQNQNPGEQRIECGMNGSKILIDTNIAILLFQGDSDLGKLLQDTEVYLSFLSELELRACSDISEDEQRWVEMFLAECTIVDADSAIKELTIYIQRQYNLKLTHAVVAATAMFLSTPLLSTDKQFEIVKEQVFVRYQS